MSLLRRPAWWAVLLTLAGTLLFLRLGVWQLDRANEKEQLLRRYATSATAPVREFAAAVDTSTADAYPHVQVHGEYLADRIYLLDNPKHDQRGGVEVYVPFRMSGQSRLLLVDLGFLPGNGTDQAPQLPPLPTGERELQGLYQPPPGVGFEMGGDALARQSSWPKTTVYLDVPQLSKDLGALLYPHVLLLDADPAAIYVREHTPDFSSMPPARHRAYAFQWFTFAVVAVVMFFILHRRRKPKASDSP
ncbi:Cytochrome oxidase assembly protein ShyY1 [Dyella sp. OK004]|uniref:SURF1 family protein n=1 Tax=Dyella sp. OK004 TaxID=1855292 RepID=UPI0008E6E62C|nr:SURF1 family protein [Dyella sp. OK004]SFR92958.1 Cytochrome oxidase assembly protein ShyY1 [Dyella sp. OK004]